MDKISKTLITLAILPLWGCCIVIVIATIGNTWADPQWTLGVKIFGTGFMSALGVAITAFVIAGFRWVWKGEPC